MTGFGGGRRWVAVGYLVTREVGLDQVESQSVIDWLEHVPDFLRRLDRRYEVRLCWDHDKSAWRLDRRVRVEGG